MGNNLQKLYKVLAVLILFLSGMATAYAQQTISGTVTDSETGETLVGVNITTAYDLSIGTVTDIDGNYSLTVDDTVSALRFSFVGYSTQVVPITSTTINVALDAGQALQEVVVIGYGTQQTREVTSAVASLKEDDFNDGNINNPIQLIQGKVAGLSIARPGGDPNADFTIRLRGLSTFGANTEPLIVIDGVQGADINSVDPEDIASIDVLKDASAAAIYGTRGASGVILITTKRGEMGPGEKPTNVEFSTNFTLEQVARKLPILTRDEYLSFSGTTDFEDDTDWIDAITRNGFTQVYNLAIFGATEQSNYRVSFNYRQGNSTVLKTGFDQLNGRLNFSQRALNNKLTIDFNLAMNIRNETYAPGEALQFAGRFNPTAPTRADDDFSQEWGGYFQREAFYFYNPLAIIEQNTLDGKKQRFIGSVKGTYEVIDGFNVSAFYSANVENNLFGQYWSKNSYWTPYAIGSHLGFARKENQSVFDNLFEFIGEYGRRVGDVNFKLLGGYSWQQRTDENFWAFGQGFLTDAFSYNSLGSASGTIANNEAMSSYKSRRTLIGFFGRLTMNWRETIFFTGNYRRDGSSMFGKNNRWGNFGGASLGVDLMKFFSIPKVDRLKLRGSYGITGNLPGEPYYSQDLWGIQNEKFFYNGEFIQAFDQVRNANPDLKWELKKELGIGLDFFLLNYRLSGSLDFYQSTSEDLILYSRVLVPPNKAAFTHLNLGELQNTGVELALGYLAIDRERFTWNTNVTFSYYIDTKLTKITSPLTASEGIIQLGFLGAPFLTGIRSIEVSEGESIGQIVAPIYLGIDTAGQLIHKDIDGDSVFKANDDVAIVGNGLPDFEFGWGNSFTFGNFYVNFFLRGVFGHSLVNVNNARYGVPVVLGIQSGMQQALDFQDATNGPVFSDVHVEKADFVKLDNFSVGYNFNFPESKYVESLQLYLSGQNLFYITNYSGVEPEVRYGDINDNNNPLAPGIDRERTYFATRSFTLGLNLRF
jgi:iron complex outermembrane receptor protein